MKHTLAWILPMLALLMGANGPEHACAQSGRYSGPALDFERIRQESPLYAACNHLRVKSGREMLACTGAHGPFIGQP